MAPKKRLRGGVCQERRERLLKEAEDLKALGFGSDSDPESLCGVCNSSDESGDEGHASASHVRKKPASKPGSGGFDWSDDECDEDNSDDERAAQHYRDGLKELFSKSKLSAKDIQDQAERHTKSKGRGANDFATAGKSGTIPGNIYRDLLKQVGKSSTAPEPYLCQVPVADPDSGLRMKIWMPVLLPHEMMHWMFTSKKMSPGDVSGERLPKSSGQYRFFSSFCSVHSLDPSSTIPVGIHGDGVPFAKGQSIECLSWNFISMPAAERIFYGLVEKSWYCNCGCRGRHTLNGLLGVFLWSLQCLFAGVWPDCRHDSVPWLCEDKSCGRDKKSGALGFTAGLQQVRGDWAWYQLMFNFPGWASKNHMCWMCDAQLDETSKLSCWNFSSSAPWRGTFHTMASFMSKMRSQTKEMSPLFRAPGFRWNFITVDVLHVCDLGVSQMVLGNVFAEFLSSPICSGNNRPAQTQCLWALIKDYYRRLRPPTRLNNLKPEMVVQSKNGPRLRAKGAETRHLIGFGFELATKMYESSGKSNLRYGQLVALMDNLVSFYSTFGKTPYNVELAAASAKNVCLIYSWFRKQASDDKVWRLKPKFHLFLHLAEAQTELLGDPALFWSYQDEDYMGFLSLLAKSRGGKRSGNKTAANVIAKLRGLSG